MIQYEDSELNPLFIYGIECGQGWIPTIIELLDMLSALDINKRLRIYQIKAKFAEFRFYYNYNHFEGDEKIRIENMINLYTQKINNICEKCGEIASKTNKNGWRYKLCNPCLEQYNNRR